MQVGHIREEWYTNSEHLHSPLGFKKLVRILTHGQGTASQTHSKQFTLKKHSGSVISISLKCETHKLKAQILTTQSRLLGIDGGQLTKDNWSSFQIASFDPKLLKKPILLWTSTSLDTVATWS
jgi:hypothetical protein